MNPIVFALRHPITMIMLVVALVGGGALALTRMRIDIFPPINQPSIYVFTNYGGYDPFQMEGLLVSPFELWFQFVDGVRSMESRSIQQVAVVKLSFYPDTDMSKAMAQVVSVASWPRQRSRRARSCPLIMQMDAGNVAGRLPGVPHPDPFARRDRRPGHVPGPALAPDVRPRNCSRPGVPCTARPSAPITVSVDPDKLRSYNLTPQDVVEPVNQGNAISPSGNLYVQSAMPLVPNNAMVREPKNFGNIPIRPGRNSFTRARGQGRRCQRTSTTATPWWTATSRSTCRSLRRTPPRRSRWCPTSRRRCRSSGGRVARGRGRQLSRWMNRRPWSQP